MRLLTSSAKVTGTPDRHGWSQVHEFTPQDEIKLNTKGKLFSVISAAIEGEVLESITYGREILTRIHEEYYGDSEKSAFNALASAVEKVLQEFGKIWDSVEIAAISIVGDFVYIAAGGGAGVALYRNQSLVKLLDSSPGRAISASGKTEEGDIVILLTKTFSELVGEGVLKAGLARKNVAECAEYVSLKVHAQNKESLASAVFVEFSKGESIERLELQEADERKPVAVNKTKSAFSSLLNKIPRRSVYVKTTEVDLESEKKKKTTLSIGIILLILLATSIVFGTKQKQKTDRMRKFEEEFSQAKHNYEEALSLFTLNPTRSRELFVSSEVSVRGMLDGGFDESELRQLEKNIDENKGKILGVYETLLEEFADVKLVTDIFNGEKMALSEDKIYILDPQGEKVVAARIDTKGAEVIAGPSQVRSAEDIASYSGLVYLLKDDGIYEVLRDQEKVIDKQWAGEILIFSFAGNIYVLEKGAGSIGRFVRGETRFSDKSEWLASGVSSDFSQAVDWVIDGAIWILKDDGTIEKYLQGNPQSFSGKGASPEVEKPKAIFASDETRFLYVLEPDKNRVVVFTKEGEFAAQYLSENLKDMKDLVVSESRGKAFLLKGDKLYSIDLKHLEVE